MTGIDTIPPSSQIVPSAQCCARGVAFVAAAATWTDGEGLTWTYVEQGDGTVILGGNGASAISSDTAGDLVIPSYVSGRRVTSIGKGAFRGCRALKSVTIPDSVTKIETDAFFECTALARVTIPGSLLEIGSKAFARCYALTDAQGFIILNDILFDYYGDAEELTIPTSVKRLSGYALYNKYALTHVTIPNGVTNIGEYAFSECSALKGVTIPSSVTHIGDNAFRKCESLESARLPNKVTEINESLFSVCYSLKEVKLPTKLKRIGVSAFEGCYSIKAMTLPPSLIAIGEMAFYNCSALQRVVFTDDILSIGRYAFCGCTSLASITFGGGEPAVGSYAFWSCPAGSVFVPPGTAGWAAAGNTWNGMTIHHLITNAEGAVYINALPEFTAFSPDVPVKVMSSARSAFTVAEAAAMANQISYIPADGDQDGRFFKAKATVNSEGSVVITAELDLEELAFPETAKAVSDQMASAPDGTVTLALPEAKAGFWYGVTAATDLASLKTASVADVAGRATADGISLTLPKPEGGSAFFKVTVSSQEIAVR